MLVHQPVITEDALSEEQFLALETLHRSEGSAWLGRDLRQLVTGARLDSNLPAMSRARGDTFRTEVNPTCGPEEKKQIPKGAGSTRGNNAGPPSGSPGPLDPGGEDTLSIPWLRV